MPWRSPLIKSCLPGFELNQIQIAVAHDIQQLLRSTCQRAQGRLFRDQFGRSKAPVAQIPFGTPARTLLRQHAGDTNAIEIEPAIVFAINSLR